MDSWLLLMWFVMVPGIEVPEPLVGDIYMAVGRVLQQGQDELDEAARRKEEDDEPADEA